MTLFYPKGPTTSYDHLGIRVHCTMLRGTYTFGQQQPLPMEGCVWTMSRTMDESMWSLGVHVLKVYLQCGVVRGRHLTQCVLQSLSILHVIRIRQEIKRQDEMGWGGEGEAIAFTFMPNLSPNPSIPELRCSSTLRLLSCEALTSSEHCPHHSLPWPSASRILSQSKPHFFKNFAIGSVVLLAEENGPSSRILCSLLSTVSQSLLRRKGKLSPVKMTDFRQCLSGCRGR